MTEHISSLKGLTLRASKYIFVLTNEHDEQSEIQRGLDKFAGKFGDSIGLSGRMIRATSHASSSNFGDLVKKNWPASIIAQMHSNQAPFLVMIKSDFDNFDPMESDWRIVWFANAKSPRTSLGNFFDALEASIETEDGIFGFLDQIRDQSSGRSVYGATSSPHLLDADASRRKAGRPGIFDPEYGVDSWIQDHINNESFKPYGRGWKTQVAKKLLKDKPELRGAVSSAKYVRDALKRKGIFNKFTPE